jgi:hypothetical protein
MGDRAASAPNGNAAFPRAGVTALTLVNWFFIWPAILILGIFHGGWDGG